MTPIEFFKKGCKLKRYKEKAWVFSVLGCTLTPPDKLGEGKYLDVQRIDGIPYWVDENGERQKFTDFEDIKDVAILDVREDIDLTPDDIPNLSEPVTTTVGNYFLNWYCLVHPFGNKIPFQTGEMEVNKLQKLIRPRFESNILNAAGSLNIEAEDPNKIYVHEYIRYIQCVTATAGFTAVCVPSATPYTGTTSPEVRKLRDRLLKEHEHELNDPTVIAAIEKQLIAEDRKWIESDPEKGFLIKSKSFNIVRKKLFMLGGIEPSFKGDGTFSLVAKSLSEGMDYKNMPVEINTLRDGSYSRGAMTALGGEAVKFFQRVLQNARIAADDCGVTYGIPFDVTADNHHDLAGRWLFTKTGQVNVAPEDTSSYIGKSVELRSPQTCTLSHTDYCARCFGNQVAESPNGIAAMGASMGSVFMLGMMKKMHGTQLSVAEYDFMTVIT